MLTFFMGLASFFYMYGLIQQIWKIQRRKMADDMSLMTCVFWVLGTFIFLIASFKTDMHWTFKINYIIHLILFVYLFGLVSKYQGEQKERMAKIRSNVMKEALRVLHGGKLQTKEETKKR